MLFFGAVWLLDAGLHGSMKSVYVLGFHLLAACSGLCHHECGALHPIVGRDLGKGHSGFLRNVQAGASRDHGGGLGRMVLKDGRCPPQTGLQIQEVVLGDAWQCKIVSLEAVEAALHRCRYSP